MCLFFYAIRTSLARQHSNEYFAVCDDGSIENYVLNTHIPQWYFCPRYLSNTSSFLYVWRCCCCCCCFFLSIFTPLTCTRCTIRNERNINLINYPEKIKSCVCVSCALQCSIEIPQINFGFFAAVVANGISRMDCHQRVMNEKKSPAGNSICNRPQP